MPFVKQHFGSEIFWSTAKCIGTCFTILSKSEIRQFQIAFLIYQDVLGLQISIDDIQTMTVFEHQRHLGGVEHSVVGG